MIFKRSARTPRLQSVAPQTHALLEKARADVFGSYGVGVSFKGQRTFDYGGCGEESLFDLASVSKVLSTTTLVAIAEQEGLLATSDLVQTYFPAFADQRVTLSHLLNHSSGLPAWLPLHALFHDEKGFGEFNPRTTPAIARLRYEKDILASHVAADFEKQCVYSDLGFLLLGWLLEKVGEAPLDALFQEWIVIKTGFESLQYLPTSPDVVPTEDCPWRKRVLRGEVHDDNTYVLGGVAGHAGLFGNVRDVVSMGELWLNAFHGEVTVLNTLQAQKFWSSTHVPNSTRVLGWDSRSKEGSSAGQYFSPAARGHLGYTGTSLWIDPEQDLVVTLLTNRVHPTRTNEKIKTFRPLFHDSLLRELGIG